MARNFKFGGGQRFRKQEYVYVEDDDEIADLLQNIQIETGSPRGQVHSIYVGKVPPEFITDEDAFDEILETFSECGHIVSWTIPPNLPVNIDGLTYFFITYSSMEASVLACQEHNLRSPYGFVVNHARQEKVRTFPAHFANVVQRPKPFVHRPGPPRTTPLLTVVAGEGGRRVSTGSSPAQGRLARYQQQDEDENLVLCDVCQAQGILICCKGCQSKYCSKICQERDFTRHRAACPKNTPSSGNQSTRQSSGPIKKLLDENAEGGNNDRQSHGRDSNFRDGQYSINQSGESDRTNIAQNKFRGNEENGFNSQNSDENDNRRSNQETPNRNFNRQNNERFENQRQSRNSQNFGDKNRKFGSGNRDSDNQEDGSNRGRQTSKVNDDDDNRSGQREFNRRPHDNQDTGNRPRKNFNRDRDNESGDKDGDSRSHRSFEQNENRETPRQRNFNRNDGDNDKRPYTGKFNRNNESGRDRQDGDGNRNRSRDEGNSNRPARQFNRNNEDGESGPRRFNSNNDGGGEPRRQNRQFNRNDDGESKGQNRRFNRDSENGEPRGRRFDQNNEGGDSRPNRNFSRRDQDGNVDRDNRDGQRRSYNRDGEDRRSGTGSKFGGGDRRQSDRNSQNGRSSQGETTSGGNADDEWGSEEPAQSDYLNKRLEAAKSGPVLGVPPPSASVELPAGVYTRVSICNQEGPLLYCVQRVEDSGANMKLLMDIARAVDKLSPIQQLSDGLFCLAKYMDGWYRAVVKQVSPKLTVYFVDYANDFDCSPADLREIPSGLCDTPKLGLKIEFVAGSPEKYGKLVENETVSVMPVKKNEKGVIIVKTENFEGATVSPGNVGALQDSAKAASAEFPIPEDIYTSVAIVYKEIDSDRTYWVQAVENVPTSNELHSKLYVDAPNLPVCEPKIAQLCCALYEGMWCRARILKTDPELQVQFLDYGNIEVVTPDVLRTIPEYATTVPPLAFKVMLKDTTPEEKYKSLGENDAINIKPLSKCSGVVIVELEGTQDTTTSVVQTPISTPTQPLVAEPVVAQTIAAVQTKPVVPPIIESNTATNIQEGMIVYISPDNNKEFFVHTPENKKTAEQLIQNLFGECPELPLCTPVVGLLCSAYFQNLWYRGKILSIEPDIKVLFIDYGNIDVVPAKDLHTLPDQFANLPPLCLPVRVEDSTPAELYQDLKLEIDTIKFRIISEVDGKFIISLILEEASQPAAAPVPSEQATVPTVGSVPTSASVECSAIKKTDYISTFKDGDTCAVEIMKVYEKFDTILMVSMNGAKYFTLMAEIKDGAEDFPEDPTFVPKIGEFAAIYSDLECKWHRGYIIGAKQKSYLAMLCDAGRVESVTRVRRLQEKYLNYPMLALKQEIIKTNTNEALDEGTQLIFIISSISGGTLLGTLKVPNSEAVFYDVKVSTWEPTLRDYGETYRYADFSTVVLRSFIKNTVTLISASSVDEQLYPEVQKKLNSHCATALPLEQLPEKLDVVAYLSAEDGALHRAFVMATNKTSSNVKVYNVDTGYSETVSLDKLKPLTLELKSYPFRANTFVLKGVPNSDLPDDACNYMQHLISSKELLRRETPISPADGVMLYRSNGECINGKINLLVRQSKQAPTCTASQVEQTLQVLTPSVPTSTAVPSSSNTESFHESLLPFKELPHGSCQLYPWLVSDDMELFCCVPDADFICNVTETMAEEIQQYCASTSEAYCPMMKELCLARFNADNSWYRAVCIKISSADTTQVELVDFGNTLTVENCELRKMSEKFLKLPRMVVKCTIEGLEIPADQNNKRAIMNALETNKTYQAKVIRKIENGWYLVSFPEILENLRSKSLII